jgi:crossover junction endodeoxyribonuclease RusA
MTIKLSLPYPPSANRYWRQNPNGGVYVSEEAQDYKHDVALLAGRTKPIDGELRLTVRLYRPRKSGDLDNRLKIMIDALRRIAYTDDNQLVEIHAYRFEDKKFPRVEVEVEGI